MILAVFQIEMWTALDTAKGVVLKFRISMVICIFTIIALTWGFSQNVGGNDVTFVGDPWAPWVYGVEGSAPEKGIAVEIIREIFKRLNGYKPVFRLFAWNQCLNLIKAGDADALILCAYNAERAGYAVYTDEIVRNKAVLVFSKGKMPKWVSLGDLKKYRMGVLAGNDYGTIFDKAAKDYGYDVNDSARSIDQALLMLGSGRIDVLLTTEIVVAEAFRSNPRNKDDFEAMVSPFSDGDIYFIAFSNKSPRIDLIPEINKIIAQIKAEGIIDKIRSKYLDK